LILLSLGTHQQAFPRALDLVEPLAISGAELVIQHGSTAVRRTMPNSTWVEFMPYDEIVEVMTKADNVVCHAGVGTIMTALKLGHRPVVIPREAQYGEHVDDHQLDIATRFSERSLVRSVTPDVDLSCLLASRVDHSIGLVGTGSMELHIAVLSAIERQSRHKPLGFLRR
jgi:UDP-N-acetylglucosamine--N-acetylmuramyl-(pentapeptide) pyrophosphoryl-undecaprenol N-acetylglucosamine transferase